MVNRKKTGKEKRNDGEAANLYSALRNIDLG